MASLGIVAEMVGDGGSRGGGVVVVGEFREKKSISNTGESFLPQLVFRS